MNNDYILARWRDAITDPPPEGKPRLVKSHHGVIQHVLFERIGSRWTHADLELGDSWWDGCDIEPGDQWLDVTDEPAVPRAQVQAAVDEMTKYADEIPGTRCARGLKWARQLIKSHTGVTPTEKNQ